MWKRHIRICRTLAENCGYPITLLLLLMQSILCRSDSKPQMERCDRIFPFPFSILAICELFDQPLRSSVVTSPLRLLTNVGWSGPGRFPKKKFLSIRSCNAATPAHKNGENCLTLCECNYFSIPATISLFPQVSLLSSPLHIYTCKWVSYFTFFPMTHMKLLRHILRPVLHRGG